MYFAVAALLLYGSISLFIYIFIGPFFVAVYIFNEKKEEQFSKKRRKRRKIVEKILPGS